MIGKRRFPQDRILLHPSRRLPRPSHRPGRSGFPPPTNPRPRRISCPCPGSRRCRRWTRSRRWTPFPRWTPSCRWTAPPRPEPSLRRPRTPPRRRSPPRPRLPGHIGWNVPNPHARRALPLLRTRRRHRPGTTPLRNRTGPRSHRGPRAASAPIPAPRSRTSAGTRATTSWTASPADARPLRPREGAQKDPVPGLRAPSRPLRARRGPGRGGRCRACPAAPPSPSRGSTGGPARRRPPGCA
ncbi:hypothetical protein SAMN05421869_10162 [Nonomuraea jiangxiensis]|uniref:Uncharacterized protein n=1 Tax=Nonomuraea jiangxiensis TaxID=633440 RepID=A0A1G7YAZ9_9ACTN|nr:hypothetical protein SAMN05421869_10162 [Nonomuraea jiangxiensis]